MADTEVFRMDGDPVCELHDQSAAVAKSLQALIERHLDTFLGIRFLASEHSTGRSVAAVCAPRRVEG